MSARSDLMVVADKASFINRDRSKDCESPRTTIMVMRNSRTWASGALTVSSNGEKYRVVLTRCLFHPFPRTGDGLAIKARKRVVARVFIDE